MHKVTHRRIPRRRNIPSTATPSCDHPRLRTIGFSYLEAPQLPHHPKHDEHFFFLPDRADLITHCGLKPVFSRSCHMAFSKLFLICIMPLNLLIKHQTARKTGNGLACPLSLIGFKLCRQELRKSEIRLKSCGHKHIHAQHTHTHTHI